jgi:hypothetical protein
MCRGRGGGRHPVGWKARCPLCVEQEGGEEAGDDGAALPAQPTHTPGQLGRPQV